MISELTEKEEIALSLEKLKKIVDQDQKTKAKQQLTDLGLVKNFQVCSSNIDKFYSSSIYKLIRG